MKPLHLILFILAFLSCSAPTYKNPHVTIETKFGDIEIELYPDKAPKTVAAFLSFIDSGFYKNSSFYRVLSTENQPMGGNAAELIQGGLYKSENRRDYLKGIPHENTRQTGLLHENGTISLARQQPGSGNTEFFICIGKQSCFDYGGQCNADGQGYAAFGKVVKGMDVVYKIYGAPAEDQAFEPAVPIYNITHP